MSCFCRRPNGLSPHIFRKIESLERQISQIFDNCVIDLLLVKVIQQQQQQTTTSLRPKTPNMKNQNHMNHMNHYHSNNNIELLYRTNMDMIRSSSKSDDLNSEETRLINQIMSAAQSFCKYFIHSL